MSHVLSPSEVDALLKGVGENQISVQPDVSEEMDGAVPYDLSSQEKVIRGRLPTLDIINQMFSRLFRNSFTSLMKKSADISAASTDSVKFGEFLRSLPVPASLHVFRMEPLRGFGLIVVESKLVFALVDNFFGGVGNSDMETDKRDFSAIEVRMTKNVVLSALEDWEKAWKPVHPVKISYVRSEGNPQFAAIVPPTDTVLVVVFDVEMENTSGSITICIPYSTVEPIIPKLKESFQSEKMEVDKIWVKRLQEELMETELEASVELGTAAITPSKFMELQVGNVLMLGNDVSDPLLVKVEGVPKFRGFPGVSRGNKAIQITEIIQRKG
jgi:flagellar motor switch protein FliM